MANPNLLTTGSMVAKCIGGLVTNALAVALANAAASGQSLIIRNFVVSNPSASQTATVEITLFDGTNHRHFYKGTVLLPGEGITLPVPFALEEGYAIYVAASVTLTMEWVAHWEIWS
jgi:hypothetical protein